MEDKDKEQKIWDKFNDLFKSMARDWEKIGKNFGDYPDDISSIINQSPEDFMGKGEYAKTEETGTDKDGNTFTKTTYMSKDGNKKFTRTVVNGTPSKGTTNTNRSNRLYTLEMDLKIAVEKQEFEKAATIRDEIAKLKEQLKKTK